jgi:hypothetical protein
MAGPLGKGLIERFKNDPGATCTFNYGGNLLNCDSPTQIMGAASTPLFAAFGSQPSWWETSLYGPWNATNTMEHVYYDGVVAKCDSPRLTQVPIVVENNNWNIGDPNAGTWPNGSKEMKIIGFLDVILKDPNDNSDFQGSGTAKRISADIVWFGPNAICSDGSPVGVLNGIIGKGENRVFLVDDTN